MKLLLVGFEPFGGSSVNPSEQVIRKLGRQRIENASIVSILLPVDRHRAPQKLLQSVTDHMPEAVLCLGEASGKSLVSIERVAINLLDFRIPDNAGLKVSDEPVVANGPTAYFATIPVRVIYNALLKARIPAEISLSAGSFLCNQVFYELLHAINIYKMGIPAGFIHLPSLPEQAAQKNHPIPSMALETSLRAVRETVRVIVDRTSQ